MNRSVVLGVGAAALVAAIAVTWVQVRQQREFRRLLAVGDAALLHDQTSVAIEAFSGAIALQSDAMVAYLRRGDTYRRRGELPAALRDLRRSSALDPTAPQPAELLGDVDTDLGRYDQAAHEYRRYLTLDDRAPRVLYKLALASYRGGQTTAAVEALRKALALDEASAESHYLLGLCLRDQRRPDDAIRELTRAVAIRPSLVPAHEALADVYGATGRRREQIEQLEALVALEPSRPQRLVDVGLTYARLGLDDAALETLRAAGGRYRDSPAVATALGRVWLETAENTHDRNAADEAIKALRPAAARDDATSETLTLYGRALLLAGDPHAAETILTRATIRTPIDPAAFTYLADAARRLGHRRTMREARANYTTLTAR